MRCYLDELQILVERRDPAAIRRFFTQTAALSGQSLAGLQFGNPQREAEFCRRMRATRLLTPGREKPCAELGTEVFLLRWLAALTARTDDGLPGAVRRTAGLAAGSDLFTLMAAAFLRMLHCADDDWMLLYLRPLKRTLRKNDPALPQPSCDWSRAAVARIPEQTLHCCFDGLTPGSPLRQAVVYDEEQLRALLACVNKAAHNGYLAKAKNYLSHAMGADVSAAAVQDVAALLRQRDGAWLLQAPDCRQAKLDYRLLRCLFFALLGTHDPLYGTLRDHRTALIQLGFALGLDSGGIDALLQQAGLPGLDWKSTDEMLFAYAADHFDRDRYAHALALQKIYALRPAAPAAPVPQQTAVYRRQYLGGGLRNAAPIDFLAYCAVQGLPPVPGDARGAGFLWFAQSMELRRMMADLETLAADDRAEFAALRRGYGNAMLCAARGIAPTDAIPGWAMFRDWGMQGGRLRRGFTRRALVFYAKYEGLFAVRESEQNDEAHNGLEVCGRQVMTALRTGDFLDRDTFVKLAFLDYLATAEAEGRTLPQDSDALLRDFAAAVRPLFARCRLLPYTPGNDLLSDAFRELTL